MNIHTGEQIGDKMKISKRHAMIFWNHEDENWYSLITRRILQLLRVKSRVEGYLTYKKPHPPRNLP